jgi:O-antigen ligase
MSVFASFAMFYFLQINKKTNIENISLNLLVIFIFLLSSKTIISIDFLIIICYYSFFAEVPKSTKIATILSISLFLFFSIFFIKEVKERFFLEYQTAFVDNTLSSSQKELKASIHNVSIQEAWSSKRFHQNDFFPGTALRVYQIRVFTELITEQNIFLKGLGLEASQKQIENKAKQHNLYYDYRNYNFHNQYIQTFAEIGFFGFLILIIVVVLNFVNAWVKKDFLHIAFAITMIMLFLSESFFCRQRGIVFFIILYCLFNSTAREDRTLLVQ